MIGNIVTININKCAGKNNYGIFTLKFYPMPRLQYMTECLKKPLQKIEVVF